MGQAGVQKGGVELANGCLLAGDAIQSIEALGQVLAVAGDLLAVSVDVIDELPIDIAALGAEAVGVDRGAHRPGMPFKSGSSL